MNRIRYASVALLLGLLLWGFGRGVLPWLGFALVLVGGSGLGPAGVRQLERLRAGTLGRGRLRLSGRLALEDLLPPLLLVGLIVYSLWPLVMGYMPISGDHPMHLYKAKLLWDQLLPGGQVIGWSQHFHAGTPVNSLYPPGVDLWICGYRGLTFGAFSWQATYAHAFLLAMIFCGLSVYWAGRVMLGRTAGLVGALLWVFDEGGFNEGGWSFAVGFGVWGQVLAIGFGIWALIGFYRIVTGEGSFRHLLLAIGGASAAALTHPNAVLMMAVFIPLVFLVGVCFLKEGRGRLSLYLLAWGVSVVVLTACFYLPIFQFGDYLYNLAAPPRGSALMAERSLDGTFFQRTMGLAVFMGLLGGFFSVVRRHQGGITLVVLAGVCLALSTTSVILTLGLLDISAEIGRLDLRRFLFIAKLPVFLLAGAGVYELFRWVQRTGRTGISPRPVVLFAVGLCVAPMGVPFVEAMLESNGKPVKTIEDHEDWPALRAFVEWAEELPDDSFYRIAYLDDDNEHFLLVAAALVGKPAFKIGFSPVDSFRYRAVSRPDGRAQRRVGVRYLVTRNKTLLKRGGYKRVAAFQGERKDLPPLYVFEKTPFSYQPFEVDGEADVTLEAFEGQSVRLNVKDAGEGAMLTLLVAEFPGWTASVNGRDVPLESVSYGEGMDMAFMRVPLEDGEWAFSFGPTQLQTMTTRFATVGWALWLLCLMATCVPVVREKAGRIAHGTWRSWGRYLAWGAGFVVAGIMLGIFALLVRGGPTEVRGTTPVWSFHEHVEDAVVWLEDQETSQEIPCDDWSLERWMCSEKTTEKWQHVGARIGNIDGLRPCIYAHPVDDKILHIEFDDVPMEDVLIGWHEILGAKKGTPVTFELSIDGEKVSTLTKSDTDPREIEFDVSKWSGKNVKVRFSVSSEKERKRDYCFQIFSARR